jgi:hypothetical protein
MDQQPTAPATTGEQSPNTQPCLCLAVTEVSNFVGRLQYCERYLALLYERKQLKSGIYAHSSHADPSYQEHGQIAEGEVEEKLIENGYSRLDIPLSGNGTNEDNEKYNCLKLCLKKNKQNKKTEEEGQGKTEDGVKKGQEAQIQWEDFVEALANELEKFSSDREENGEKGKEQNKEGNKEKKYYAREVEICTKVHDFCLIGRIDFILIDITKAGEQNTSDNTPNQRPK